MPLKHEETTRHWVFFLVVESLKCSDVSPVQEGMSWNAPD